MPPKAGEEVWKFGINDRVKEVDALPASFQTTGTIRGDYLQVAKAIGVIAFHPAFKLRQAKGGKLPGRSSAGHLLSFAEGDAAATADEQAIFTVHTVRFDRISAHILGLVLPEMRSLKVLRFIDCRLDFEMMKHLRAGLSGNCSVECLQIEWNPVDDADLLQNCPLSPQATTRALQQAQLAAAAGGENEEPFDLGGAALAAFAEPECVLECLCVRACNVSQMQIALIAASLTRCPWQLRQLNLWENEVDDVAAKALANAIREYRGLEYLGLGRNRITDVGMKVLLAPLNSEIILDEAESKIPRDKEKEQRGQLDAELKAKAKAKAKAKPEGARRIREPVITIDEVEERPPPEGAEAGPSWVVRKFSEVKAVSLVENPIKSAAEVERLQPLGPRRAELALLGTAAAAAILARFPDLPVKDRKAFVFPTGGQHFVNVPGGSSDGWTLRLI